MSDVGLDVGLVAVLGLGIAVQVSGTALGRFGFVVAGDERQGRENTDERLQKPYSTVFRLLTFFVQLSFAICSFTHSSSFLLAG